MYVEAIWTGHFVLYAKKKVLKSQDVRKIVPVDLAAQELDMNDF